jgi:uncharacterized protein YxjI
MALCIREQIFSTVKKYEITDLDGNTRYTTEGRAPGQFVVMGEQIHIFNLAGKEVAFVRQRFPSLFGKYDLYINGEKKGQIKGCFSFFRPRYKVSYLGMSIKGDILGFNFQIFQNGRLVASMIPQVISIGTVYTLSCEREEDELAALTLSIAIAGIGAKGMAIWDFN